MTKPQEYKDYQYEGPSDFVHLHNHTVFSKLDGVATPEQYAAECAKRGYRAMSATEHGNIASVPDMYVAFQKHKLKYIAGCEIYYNDHHLDYVTARTRHKATATAQYFNASEDKDDWRKYLQWHRSRHLTVLAKNQVGFTNLVKLCTDVHKEGWQGQRGRSRAWFDMLARYREGLIILSGCLNGPLSYVLKQREPDRIEWEPKHKPTTDRSQENSAGKQQPMPLNKKYYRIREVGKLLPEAYRIDQAVRIIKRFREVFGEDYYIETQTPLIPTPEGERHIYNADFIDLYPYTKSVELAHDLGIKCVLTNDCHYMRRKDYELQRVMMAIDQGLDYNSKDLFITNSQEQYMKTRDELWATYMNYPYHEQVDLADFEHMCDNTLEVADKCQPLKVDQSPKTPIWKKSASADDTLREQTYRALQARGYWDNPKPYEVDGKSVTYREQADIELERFISKGFASYFLITADLVQEGKSRGFPFNPRGSAGGSLVCMLLGIHSLDPLKWGLSFDRFMSPSRGGYMLKIKMPDAVQV